MILRVSDLKQYAYCPRIVFYTYLMPVEKKTTFKMEEGRASETDVIPKERRRTLSRYELPPGNRTFGVWLASETVGLSGKLDMLVESESHYYPVEYKTSRSGVHENARVQLAGYALLIESKFRVDVDAGFVSFLPEGDVERVELTAELKDRARASAAAMRAMIREERMPEPTSNPARCADCEYANFCGDVW